LKIEQFKSLLLKDKESLETKEQEKKEKEAKLARKVDEAEERYQQRNMKEVEDKHAKLEKNKAKDLSSEINNGDKSTNAGLEKEKEISKE
jgi:hypothetical protein